jgi:transcriptional regulator with XRE-family HTH domain
MVSYRGTEVEGMDFKERLRELRKKRGYSQVALAEKIGVSKSTIGAYETGDIKPSIEALQTLADFFNVNLSYLMGEEDGSTYYLDPEAAEMANELFHRPEMRVLFDASRKLTKEDIEMVTALIQKMNGE